MALPPKGAWKHLLSVGFGALTKYPAAWPPIMVIVLAKISMSLLGGHLIQPYVPEQYYPLVVGLMAAPAGFLLSGYCVYGLLFGFAKIRLSHFFQCLWRYFLASLLIIGCLIGILIPLGLIAGGVGFIMGYSQIHLGGVIGVITSIVLPIVLLILTFVLLLWSMIRLSFMAVIAVAEGRISLTRAWRLSKGWAGALIASFLPVMLLSALVPGALLLTGHGADQSLMMGVSSIVSPVTTLVYYAIIVTAYKKAAQDQPSVPLAVESF